MAKTKISEFSSTPANNTDIDSINIAEGCAPSGINDAIRELMAQLKDFQTGAVGDSFNGPIGTSTASTGAFTTLSATGAITSTLATGTAPLVIASTTKVANLNVDLLDGADWAAPAALGSTTPAAVSATTLSASSTVTLSGGTANGVAYLNGSKVVTSGSALVFDGTNLGVGTTTTNAKLTVKQDAADGLFIKSADSNYSSLSLGIAVSSGITYLQSTNSGTGGQLPFAFYIGGSEQMRLTSTGLGIGTSSPAYKLDIAGASYARLTTTTYVNGGFINARTAPSNGTYNTFDFVEGSTTTGYLRNFGSSFGAGSNNQIHLWNTQSSDIVFGTNNAEKMRLDSSGNLGLGVTPSANTLSKGFDLLGGAGLFGYSNNNYLTANTYYDGAFKYKANGFASYYGQGSGTHQWHTAPSGTAGNAITFTQAMTLSSGGDLLVGTTSVLVGAGSIKEVAVNGANGAILSLGYGGTLGSYFFQNGNNTLVSNVLNGYLSFSTNNTERARIDSSGNLLVGTTNTDPTFNRVNGIVLTSTGGFSFRNSSGGDMGASTTNANHINFFTDNGSARVSAGAISSNGSTTTYGTSSDYRMKTDVQPMIGALEKVLQLAPVTYKWIEGLGGTKQTGQGFIAHELAEVCPDCVTGEKDAVDEEGNPKYQGIDTSFLVATLTAAIQEQQAIIESLKARLDAANL